MKIIRIIFFSFLALCLVACTGIFIFFQVFNTDQYLPQITKKASLVLGRTVSVGSVGLGLSSQGITLDASSVVVADDPDFTKQPFIKIDKVRIGLDLRSLVLQQKIHITAILLQSPQVHFIHDQGGNFNVRSLGPIFHRTVIPAKSGPQAGHSQGSGIQTASVIARSQSDEAISDRTTKPFDSINITIQNASISYIDQNQSFPLDIWLNGLNAHLNSFSLLKPDQLSFNACLLSNTPNIQASAVLSFAPSKSSLEANGLKLQIDLSHLDKVLLKAISPAMNENSFFNNMTGIVRLNLDHLGISSSGDFAANGNLSITGGVIKKFNILTTVLSHTLQAFGGMGFNFDNLLKGPLKDKLSSEDTVIKKAEVQFSLHDRSVLIDDSLIETNIFEFKAQGTIDQGLNMNMQTMLHLNNDVTDAFTNEFEGFKYLCDDSNRIAIGASLTGVIPHLKYKPNKDFRKKSKKALMQEGGNILGVLLGGR